MVRRPWFTRSRPRSAYRSPSTGDPWARSSSPRIPTDEIAEIWDGIVTQIEVGSAIAAALLLITMTVVNRALEPIKSLARCDGQYRGGPL